MKLLITLCILIFSISKVNCQEFPHKIGSTQDTKNINSQDGYSYQDLKRSTVFFYPFEEIVEMPSLTCSATFVNTTDQESNKIYLLTTTSCVSQHAEGSIGTGYISFDFEMSEGNRKGNSNEDAFISTLHKVDFRVLVKDQSISLIELVIFDNKILDYAYTAGWNNTLDNITYSNISHPNGDHKKLYFNPENISFDFYNIMDEQFNEFYGIAYTNQDYEISFDQQDWNGNLTKLYTGSDGSGHFDKEQSLRAITSNPIRFDHISNAFYDVYESSGIIKNGLKKFLDENNTWLNKVPGGYYRHRLSINNTSNFQLTLQPNNKEITNVNIDEAYLFDSFIENNIKVVNPSFLYRNLDNIDNILSINLGKYPWMDIQGINVHELNNTKLTLNVYYLDRDRTTGVIEQRLIYGVIVDNTTDDILLNGAVHPEYNFKGKGYKCNDIPLGIDQDCNRLLVYEQQQQQGDSDNYKSEYLKAVVDTALDFDKISMISEIFIPIKVSLKNIGSSPAVINAVSYPGDVPKNALQLFKPQEVLDKFQSISYPPSRLNSASLNIASIKVSQDGIYRSPLGDDPNLAGEDYNKTISTSDNGGFLNLVNRNFLIGPIELSPSEEESEKSTFKIKLNLDNPNNKVFSYSVWIDYFKDYANNGFDFIPDGDGSSVVDNLELLKSDTNITGNTVEFEVDLPAFNNIFLENGIFGEKRMRISIKEGNTAPNTRDKDGNGEVEDYLIKFMVPLEVIREREQLREQAKIWHNQGNTAQDPANPNADPAQTPLHDSTNILFTYGTFGGTCEDNLTCSNIYIDEENAMEENNGQCYDLTGQNIIYLDNTNLVINTNSFSDRTISIFYKEDSSLPVENRREILYQSGNPDGDGDDFIIIALEDDIPVVHARINNNVIDMTKEIIDKPESTDEWLWKHASLVLKAGLLELYYNGNKISERNTTTTVVQHNGIATIGGSDNIINSPQYEKNFSTDRQNVYTNYTGFVDNITIHDTALNDNDVAVLSVHNTQVVSVNNTNTTQNNSSRAINSSKNNDDVTIDEQVDTPSDFSIFPNPASSKLNILVEVKREGPLQIDIYDINARHVYTMSEPSIGVGHQYIRLVNLNLSDGNYILKVKAGDVNRTEQIIIKR
ncbi:hypothetical protein KORDIASMS9_02930 [Kordia sp. SMS9]|uniref:T9SS type A sorting domain-containing protein n=1 Tax=Kordia sp. SMS9 TaxID=2282170 RepID=UPI000E0D38C7|nr:T9SS type A sorting domain-containing protein [Kordia sp. SMS9]AXG70684.1 hypothetical protein KORDIASMS9_02930 [Kordia sp. SMS9]